MTTFCSSLNRLVLMCSSGGPEEEVRPNFINPKFRGQNGVTAAQSVRL